MTGFNPPLLKQSFQLSLKHLLTLGALFVGFDLLFEAIEWLLLGTDLAHLDGHSETPGGLPVLPPLKPLLAVLGLLLLLAPVELVLMLAILRGSKSAEAIRFLRERYSASFKGFFQGIGRLLLVSLGLTILAVALSFLLPSATPSPHMLEGFKLLATIPILFFILPYFFATYSCILHAPIAFAPALQQAKFDLRGRYVEVVISLLIAALPYLLASQIPFGSSAVALVGGSAFLALLTLPPSILTYVFFQQFEARAMLREPFPLA